MLRGHQASQSENVTETEPSALAENHCGLAVWPQGLFTGSLLSHFCFDLPTLVDTRGTAGTTIDVVPSQVM